MAALGDEQFAYRRTSIFLQNIGDTGGRTTSLDDYNMHHIAQWLFFADKLDTRSQFVPFLAAYYFGGTEDPSKLPPIIEYLETVGTRPGGARWRWLAQAVYLARFKMNDLDLAYDLSLKLAQSTDQDRPAWTMQMPAFILKAQGNETEAVSVMMEILRTSVDDMHPNEVQFTKDYICDRILKGEGQKKPALCAQP